MSVPKFEEIEPEKTYTWREFAKLISVGEQGFTTLRRRGLRTRTVGNRLYVKGSDALDWWEKRAFT